MWKKNHNSTEHDCAGLRLWHPRQQMMKCEWNLLFDHYPESPACSSPPNLAPLSSRWLTNSKQVLAGLTTALSEPDEYATNLHQAPCVIITQPADSHNLDSPVAALCEDANKKHNCFPIRTDLTLRPPLCCPWPKSCRESSTCLNLELVSGSPF